MIAVLVSAFMWLLVASLLVLRRGRSERNITYAALTIAIATTLNIDGVYRPLDTLAGGTNLITLVADVALMVGVYFLGRGVLKASEHAPGAVRLALGKFTLAAALVSAIAAFLLIDRGSTTTNFMLDLGAQPSTALYSMIHFVYYGIVLAAMAALAARQLGNGHGVQLVPPVSLLIGSILGVLLSVVVIAMDVAHVIGDLDLMTAVGVAYGPLYLLTFFFLCLGFAGQPAARTLQARSRERQTRMLVEELAPIWTRATSARPGISQNEDVVFPADEPDALLHRRVVETRDALIDTRVSFDLSDRDRRLVERAEHHLLGADSSSSSTTASPMSKEGQPRE